LGGLRIFLIQIFFILSFILYFGVKIHRLKNFTCYILLFTLIFLFSGKDVSGQTAKLNFKHISYKEGLVQSPISNFLQDDKGFIWFGTLKGLNRFDGYEFKTFMYNENDRKSLINNRVNIIFQDSDKNLWIGTANGVSLYHRDSETFSPVDVLEIKGGRNYVSSIIEDQQHNLWIGTFAGIRKLNRKTRKLEEVITLDHSESLRSEAIFSLFLDKDNQIWAGTKRGIRKFNPQTRKLMPLSAVFDRIAVRNNVNILVSRQDNSGNLWFGTESSGVYKYEKDNNQLIHYSSSDTDVNSLASNWVKDILIYDANTVWFGTRNGISILSLKSGKFSTASHDPKDSHSLNDNAIWCFMKDKASCVWVGTFTGGINFYYQGNANFQNISESVGGELGLNHVLVNAIEEDKDGSLWIGTFGGGLNHINRERGTNAYYFIRSLHHGRAANGVKSLADGGGGKLWIGSLDGLSLFNKTDKTFKYFNFPVTDGKLSENLINTLLPDGAGVWVGTNGGGLRYVLPEGASSLLLKKGKGEIRLPAAEISDNFVTALLKDTSGNLWIGTQNGLNYYDAKRKLITQLYKKVRNTKYQLSNNNISALYRDSKGRLWVGTEGGGLNYFDEAGRKFYAISKKLGLGDDVIHAIVEDEQQNLWLSTDLGLFKVKIKHFSLPFLEKNLELTDYTANDGLINNQFSGNAGRKLRSGELIFGGINGLSLFYPERIVKNMIAPQVALTQILINNKTVSIDSLASPLTRAISEVQQIVLEHDQSNLTLRYAALNFINPQNNQYAYKLEGLPNGDQWQQSGTERVVNFANLSPGKYRFKVKAANNDGVWGTAVRVLDIEVLPPWWRSWWAYLIDASVVVFILAVFFNFFRNRAILKRNLYLEQVNHLRQQELYQMKLNFFTNISHEIRTPLTLILGPLEKLIATQEEHNIARPLMLIRHNADRLMKLVTELLDFRKVEEGHLRIHFSEEDLVAFCEDICRNFEELAAEKKISFEFLPQTAPVWVYFEKDQLEKVIFNLLSNAFKFTPSNGTVKLTIEKLEDKGGVELCVSNTGNFIPPEVRDKLFDSFFQSATTGKQQPGTGVGLALSKSIVALHKGTIKVLSEDGAPALTRFIVFLQTGSSHLSAEEIRAAEAYFREEDVMPLPAGQRIAEAEHESDLVNVSTANAAERSSLKKRYSILVAEDNAEVRQLITDTLAEEYEVVEFENGTDALIYMENQLPDLIVSDVMMPGMDGLELCERVKTTESTSHIPVVLLTARAAISHQVDGLSKGADAYISKPFSLQVLLLNIRNLLKAQEVLRSKFSERFLLHSAATIVTTPEEKFIHKLTQIISDKMGDPDFDVNALVTEIGMSRTVLYKKVQAITNFAVADLIKHMRLQKAAKLLATTSYAVAEVAYLVGFNDRKHFSREFKKQYTVSPSIYQQEQKTND